MLRLLSKILLVLLPLTAVAQQPQSLRWFPPFGGLNMSLDNFSIPDNEFTILDNASLDNLGQIYKRGSLSNLNVTGIPDNPTNSVSKSGIKQMYSFYTTAKPPDTLISQIIIQSIGGLDDADDAYNKGAQWYWFNKNTNKFFLGTGLIDTFPQVGISNLGVGIVGVSGNPKISYLAGNATRHVGNGFWGRGANAPSTLYNLGEMLVANDTILFAGIPPTTTVGDDIELWFQSPVDSVNAKTYYGSAIAYNDTLYFSRAKHDAVGWDGQKTVITNIVEWGTASRIRAASSSPDTLYDSSKSWPLNEFTGLWLRQRMANHYIAPAASDTSFWSTSFTPIIGNGANYLVLGHGDRGTYTSLKASDTTSLAYAIVSLPVQEFVDTAATKITGGANPPSAKAYMNPYKGKMDWQYIVRHPCWIYVDSGSNGVGQIYQIDAFFKNNSVDTAYFRKRDTTSLFGALIGHKVNFVIDRFPSVKSLVPFKSRMLWVADTSFPNSFWYSELGRPGYIKPNRFEVINPVDGQKIVIAWGNEDYVYFGKYTLLYALVGDNPTSWSIIQLSNSIGVSSPHSVVTNGPMSWFYGYPGGFYEMSGLQLNPDPISNNIRSLVDSINTAALEKIFGVYYKSKNGDLILWGIPVGASTKPDRFIAYSPAEKKWSTWSFVNGIHPFLGMVETSPANIGRLVIGHNDSAYIFAYNPDGTQDSFDGRGTPTLTQNYAAVIQSKRLNPLGGFAQLRLENMYVQWTAGSTTGSSFNIDLYKNNGSSSLQTRTIGSVAGLQDTKKNFGTVSLGNQIAWRITVVAPQTFRLGGVEIELSPYGRRLAR